MVPQLGLEPRSVWLPDLWGSFYQRFEDREEWFSSRGGERGAPGTVRLWSRCYGRRDIGKS